jgi:hypothetical protein
LFYISEFANEEVEERTEVIDGKARGKGSVGRPRCRWVDNIEMHLRDILWRDIDWTYLAQDKDQWRALVTTVMNIRVP